MVEQTTPDRGEPHRASTKTGLKSLVEQLEVRHRREELGKQSREIELRMSIRAKISVSLLVVIVMILPAIGMTIHYFAQMRKKVDAIAHTDAKLIDLANRIDEAMLEAKRAEGSFIFLQDSLYIERNYQATRQIEALCNDGQKAVQREGVTFQNIAVQVNRYQNSFATLVKSLEEEGVRDQTKDLRQAFSSKFTDTITRYQAMLTAAAKETDDARRDSLLNVADHYLRSFSIDDLNVGIQSKRSLEITVLSQNLNEISQKIRSLASELEGRSWRQVELHREESEIVVARAQRNITVVLILTFLVSTYLVFLLPARIVRPISAITNIIKRVEQGDYEITARSATQDEVGQLALFLNRMLKRVRDYDRLKTEKIYTQQRKVEAMANVLDKGVVILNREGEITLVNRALEDLVGWRRDVVDQPVSEVDSRGELTKLVEEALEKRDDVEADRIHLVGEDGQDRAFSARIHLLSQEQGAIFALLILLTQQNADVSSVE